MQLFNPIDINFFTRVESGILSSTCLNAAASSDEGKSVALIMVTNIYSVLYFIVVSAGFI